MSQPRKETQKYVREAIYNLIYINRLRGKKEESPTKALDSVGAKGAQAGHQLIQKGAK